MKQRNNKAEINDIYKETCDAWQQIHESRDKIIKCINSSTTKGQFDTCATMIVNFRQLLTRKYNLPNNEHVKNTVLQKLGLWKASDVKRELIFNGMNCAIREMTTTLFKKREENNV
jgi:hypothetical protein